MYLIYLALVFALFIPKKDRYWLAFSLCIMRYIYLSLIMFGGFFDQSEILLMFQGGICIHCNILFLSRLYCIWKVQCHHCYALGLINMY